MKKPSSIHFVMCVTALLLPVWNRSTVTFGNVYSLDTAGITVKIAEEDALIKISFEPVGRFEVKLNVHPENSGTPITIHVELAGTGPKTWPAEYLCVLDESGQTIPIRRNGIEWHRFDMTVPGVRRSYMIRAVPPDDVELWPKLSTENERIASDPETGITVSISKWYGGRKGALSIRFDDSHPTHLSKVIPLLDEFGFSGTFMINPGNAAFQNYEPEWEACARTGRHEFANHTLHHRGAKTEEEIEREIGKVSEYIWSIFPHRSKLVAFNRGGGTTWITRKPFIYYLRKYHLFHVTGSLGMDDVYGNRIAALRRHMVRHIERAGWCRIHFHSIGAGLATSEDNFLAAMQLIEEHESQIWIAGLANVYKYNQERNTARLAIVRRSSDYIELELSCGSAVELYDHPLTLQADLPHNWPAEKVCLMQDDKNPVSIADYVSEPGRNVVRWNVPPVNGRYTLCKNP